MTGWVENEVVHRAFESGIDDELRDAGVSFCLSTDRRYCVLVREHSAWIVPGEGWREANNPPEPGEQGRPVLNFYKAQVGNETGCWYKTLIPQREGRVQLIPGDDSSCIIRGDKSQLRFRFERIDGLMWDLMTGSAQAEEEIERVYSLLDEK